ncbi:glutamyl-tRNA reductase [Phycicoccus endophyticus]|uniref:Glutamyl-tRNA reductase n=1 Tax=Phycicoccus endophyticus TaxID=1690220 RepID=A0A7G9QZK0_9MICO|nr:glutamyl-tRNA reductase [Phycicoccus endophyticus]NHI19142.1 glutamyl-tRNA reductase [Phycicoccus endophyticus]QNN48775.1 glutamyl-tRNA reductase [Phycicoccus endophyticus]
MSLVVLGLSHHQAPLSLLESVALDGSAATALEADILRSEHVTEAVVLSTCNRTEVYAESLTFHGALVDVTNALAEACGVERAELQPHLYVHYEDRGICHAFTVASGLDSMAVGEAQILGQVRRSLSRAQKHGHVGPALNALLQQALRVAKRVHSETEIDLVSGSLVLAGLTRAEAVLGGLGARSVLVVGAGGMGALAAATAARHGVGGLVVANRDPDRARTVAERVGGRARPLTELRAALAEADVVLASTGARGRVVTAADAGAALAARDGRPQVYVDLALPHDVDVDVAALAGATRVGLAELGEDLAEAGSAPQVAVANELVTAEVAAYLVERSAQAVAPTVTALRARAGELVAAELARLERRTPGLDAAERAEVRRAVERVVDKLLHTPTVRVKELAQEGQGGSYARALSELFDLDPRDVSLVSAPPTLPGEER